MRSLFFCEIQKIKLSHRLLINIHLRVFVSLLSAQATPRDFRKTDLTKLTSENDYPFSYLHDETQEITKAYGVIYTSDLLVYNEELSRMDDSRPRKGTPSTNEL
jgi:hypothetical protein